MVEAAVGLLATLAAFGGAGLLAPRALPERRPHLYAWLLTLAAMGIAALAMTAGFAMGFSPALLRALVLGGALIAPFALALGVVELVARTVQARFAARLIAASYVIVAVVIILLDPILGKFGKALPKVSGHYSSLPRLVLDGSHVFAVVVLVSCVAVTALRARGRDRTALVAMPTVAVIALGGVFLVAAARGLLPGPLTPFALGVAAGLVWFGANRLLPQDEEDEEDYEEEQYAPPRPAPQQPALPQAPARQPALPQPPPRQPAPQGSLPARSGQQGRITVYTLLEGRGAAFDQLAGAVIQAARDAEPGTVVFTVHYVANAPTQRLIYQLFNDEAALEHHQRQPHVQRFAAEIRPHVVATNVIDLTLKTGKLPEAVRWPHG